VDALHVPTGGPLAPQLLPRPAEVVGLPRLEGEPDSLTIGVGEHQQRPVGRVENDDRYEALSVEPHRAPFTGDDEGLRLVGAGTLRSVAVRTHDVCTRSWWLTEEVTWTPTGGRIGKPAARHTALTVSTVSSPRWKIPAARAASASPSSSASRMCSALPAPPEATTGTLTARATVRMASMS